jgi:tetratricopeptide (TPR) repeat protein
MKPYGCSVSGARPLLFSLVVVVAICTADTAAAHPFGPGFEQSHSLISERAAPLIRSGDAHYYSLEYDKALKDYEHYAKQHPGDAYAINQELKAVIFRELYRLNLLDTTMYAKDGFLNRSQPEAADPRVQERVDGLYADALDIVQARLKTNPDDVDALYCRGVAKGLHATYLAMVDKSYVPALRAAVGARHDHERVLELDPEYLDAKTVVGTHLYIVGSLSLPMKMLAGLSGLSGNKKKGLQYLNEVADSDAPTSVDARVALALFLRREAKYDEALAVARSLREQYPRNFLFALEEANLLKDKGSGTEAAVAYRRLLDSGGKQYPDGHFELAAFGLGESLRGQKDLPGAVRAYDSIGDMKNVQPHLRTRALLASGQVYEKLGNVEMASKRYKQVVAADGSGTYGNQAARALKSIAKKSSKSGDAEP